MCSRFGDLDDDYGEGFCFRKKELANPTDWCEDFEMNDYYKEKLGGD